MLQWMSLPLAVIALILYLYSLKIAFRMDFRRAGWVAVGSLICVVLVVALIFGQVSWLLPVSLIVIAIMLYAIGIWRASRKIMDYAVVLAVMAPPLLIVYLVSLIVK